MTGLWEPCVGKPRIFRRLSDEIITPPSSPVFQGADAELPHDFLDRTVISKAHSKCMPLESFEPEFLGTIEKGMVHWRAVLDYRTYITAVQLVQMLALEAASLRWCSIHFFFGISVSYRVNMRASSRIRPKGEPYKLEGLG